MRGGDHAKLAGLVILERLDHLVARVHHEWPEPGDRLLNRESAKDQHVQRRRACILMLRSLDHDAIAITADGELARLNGNPFGANAAAPRERVDERIEIWSPRQVKFSAWLNRCVHQRDRCLC